jgi:hypothetical protein
MLAAPAVAQAEAGPGRERRQVKKKGWTGFAGLKTGLTGFLLIKILNPVNPEKSC